MRYYPFVLGAQPVRPIDLAAFYAAIANEGAAADAACDRIDRAGRPGCLQALSRPRRGSAPASIGRRCSSSARILQGVVARGTAARLERASRRTSRGKTGTSDEWNDAWFVGFSNDVTIAVWVGYDNAKGKRTLGQRPGRVAGSRCRSSNAIMQAVWAQYAPQTALLWPSPEAARSLVALPIDVRSRARGCRDAQPRRLHGVFPARRKRPGRRVAAPADRRAATRIRISAQAEFFGFRFGDFGRRDYDGMPPQRCEAAPPPFFLPFFGGGGPPEPDPRASARRSLAGAAAGAQRRYAERRKSAAPRPGDFFGRRGGFRRRPLASVAYRPDGLFPARDLRV